MKEIIVRVGFYDEDLDQTRPIKFRGEELLAVTNASNDTAHPNYRRHHVWVLYRVEGGFRVLDSFKRLYKLGSNHNGLTAVLQPIDIAKHFPLVSNAAIKAGCWTEADAAEEASAGEELGKPAEYKYDPVDTEEE